MSAERPKGRQKSLKQLEDQLRGLKEKEKYYLQLSAKVKDLQDKSKRIKKSSEDIHNENFDNEQIQKLKIEIQKTLADTKKIEDDNRIIKQQTRSLQNQLKALQGVYNTLCGQNKTKRQRIQLRDQLLLQKENQIESLIEKRNCNQLVVEELRVQITKLQDQQAELREELENLRLQRQEEEKQKDRLRSMVAQCKRQINDQQKNTQGYRIKIAQVREANYVVKQQLISLIKLQEKLKSQLDSLIESYNNAVELDTQSQTKLQSLEDQLICVEQDLKVLTDQYLKEGQILRQQQALNHQLNNQIDKLSKQALLAWQNVRQLIDIQGEDSDLKAKAYRVWIEISQILSLK